MTVPPAPAGWYPDPAGSPALRWFDGATWTNHLQAAAATASYGHPGQPQPAYQPPGYQQPVYQQPTYQQPGLQPPGYGPPGHGAWGYGPPGQAAPRNKTLELLLPVNRTALSVIAGYLGLFSITLVLAPVAVVVSALALRQLRHRPESAGRGRAWFGLVAGSICTLTFLATLLFH